MNKTKTFGVRITEENHAQIVRAVAQRMMDTGEIYSVGEWVRDLIEHELYRINELNKE